MSRRQTKRLFSITLILLTGVLLFSVQQQPDICAGQGACPPPHCPHVIEELPLCGGEYGMYYRQMVTVDDDGSFGPGDVDQIVFAAPDADIDYTSFWWRMHDHEMDAHYSLYISSNGSNWIRIIDDASVHTSGGCEESCSRNADRDHPPGDQGCSTPPDPGPLGWFHEPDPSWSTRNPPMCAQSFDEHQAWFPPGFDVNYVMIEHNEWHQGIHIHLHDVIWTSCQPYPVDPQLTVDYPWLIWYGPHVGQPTQVIRGTDFFPAGDVTLHLWGPVDAAGDPTVCAQETTYTVTADSTGAFTFTAADAGNGYLGTQCKGTWQVWAEDQTTAITTDTVPWVVSWFPVHLKD